MHLIRDCTNAKERWRSMVAPNHWNQFIALSGKEWIMWNLKHDVGRAHTKKISWPTLFGYTCWDIWKDRCKKVFNEEIADETANATESLLRALWDQELATRASFLNSNDVRLEAETNRQQGFYHLETDGSVLSSGSSGCGGIIKNSNGDWRGGYALKLTNVPPSIAELIAIIQGLQICRNRSYKKIHIWTNSLEAVNLLMRGCLATHPFKEVIDEARLLFGCDWQVILTHRQRDENTQADWLAKSSHTIQDNFCYFDRPPPPLQGAYSTDITRPQVTS